MKLLFIGDIFGNIGRRILAERLPSLIQENAIDITIGNGENAAGGRGLTGNIYKKLRKYGLQVVTGGNHSFSIPDGDLNFMNDPNVLRPLNYPPGNIGKGYTIFNISERCSVGIINVQGRTFLHEALDCPFRTVEPIIEEIRKKTPLIVVDFHAEASSEKSAFAHYFDGSVSAIVGTHTHVQTADERLLPHGTAFITDVGMTGPEDSIIGMSKDAVIKRFILQTPVRFEPSEKGPMLNAVIINIDESTGRSISIQRIFERITFHE